MNIFFVSGSHRQSKTMDDTNTVGRSNNDFYNHDAYFFLKKCDIIVNETILVKLFLLLLICV